MQARFINPHLNKLQEDFVYTNPYISFMTGVYEACAIPSRADLLNHAPLGKSERPRSE